MDPMLYDTACGDLAAIASSRDDGRTRWTELRVFHMPLLKRCWLAEASGCSDVPGEVTKTRRIASASLERALRLFDDSDLGIVAKEMAHEYAEENGLPKAPKGYQPKTNREAVDMLFGEEAVKLTIEDVGRHFGIGPVAAGHALDNDNDLRVPLLKLFPFIDRAAFQRAMAEEARG